MQRWNRENIPNYREIYLRVPIAELRDRDSKGIYAGPSAAMHATLLALTCRRKLPEAPDLVLDNYGALDVAAAVDRIGLPGYPAPARQPWGENCGAGCVLPVVRSSSSMATRSVL